MTSTSYLSHIFPWAVSLFQDHVLKALAVLKDVINNKRFPSVPSFLYKVLPSCILTPFCFVFL